MPFERGWQLAYPGVVYEWGGVNPADPFRRNLGRPITMAPPAVSDTELETDDSAEPRQDGVRFGSDFRRGRTWTFTLGIKGTTRAGAEAFLSELERVWRGDGVRLTPGAYAAVSFRPTAGIGLRTMYGRPRKFTPVYDLVHAGQASALVTFDARDDLWYGSEQSVRVDLAPSAAGGISAPFVTPLVVASTSQNAEAVVVDGNMGAVVAAELHGPIVNPTVRLTNGWSVKLATTLLAGQVVTLDARPWARTILRSDGASYAGYRARGQGLADMVLPPGVNELALLGSDPSGTGYMALRWQTVHAGRS